MSLFNILGSIANGPKYQCNKCYKITHSDRILAKCPSCGGLVHKMVENRIEKYQCNKCKEITLSDRILAKCPSCGGLVHKMK